MNGLFVLLKYPYELWKDEIPSKEKQEEYVNNSDVFGNFWIDIWQDGVLIEELSGQELHSAIKKLNSYYPNLIRIDDEGNMILKVSTDLRKTIFTKNKDKLKSQFEKLEEINNSNDLVTFIDEVNKIENEIFEDKDNYMGFYNEDSLGLSGFIASRSEIEKEYQVYGIYSYSV